MGLCAYQIRCSDLCNYPNKNYWFCTAIAVVDIALVVFDLLQTSNVLSSSFVSCLGIDGMY